MKTILTRTIAIGILLLGLSTPAAYAQEGAAARGKRLYLSYCASCHGMRGEGDGPVARALTTPPANLRLLSERFGNPLPEEKIARFIDGRSEIRAHGPRDMPVWGRYFYSRTDDERAVHALISDLVAYLQSLQASGRQAKNHNRDSVRAAQL